MTFAYDRVKKFRGHKLLKRKLVGTTFSSYTVKLKGKVSALDRLGLCKFDQQTNTLEQRVISSFGSCPL